MHPPFQIDLRSMPIEGMHITGSAPAEFFLLPETDSTKAISPLVYDLRIFRDGEDLIAVGSVEASFSLECGRCLGRFDFVSDIPDYAAEVPIEKETTIDLTDVIREDILLALPSYPRCEDGNIDPRDCPAEGRFDPVDDDTPADEPQNAGQDDAWNALDQLK